MIIHDVEFKASYQDECALVQVPKKSTVLSVRYSVGKNRIFERRYELIILSPFPIDWKSPEVLEVRAVVSNAEIQHLPVGSGYAHPWQFLGIVDRFYFFWRKHIPSKEGQHVEFEESNNFDAP